MSKKVDKKDSVIPSANKQLSLYDLYDEGKCVSEINLSELHEPDYHPFQVKNDEAMIRLVESIKQFGVNEPGLARTRSEGGYELLCGNRRKYACKLAGIDKMPVIIRELDDDLAVIAMVDSNLQQRERLLPSEQAWAYKMKMDALNHKGIKAEKLSCEIVAEQTGESVAQIFRLIRLTELIEILLDKVDLHQLAFTPAVELSYLTYDEQHIVAECMSKYEIKPSLSQAVKLKKLKKEGTLTIKIIEKILSEEKGNIKSKIKEEKVFNKFKRFFPENYTVNQIENAIIKLLQNWKSTPA